MHHTVFITTILQVCFFSSRRRHTRYWRDWSSDVCSSDLVRARAHIEELRGGRTAVIVTELPYGVRKGGDEGVIAKIADLVKENTLTEISGIKDLSDKTGMRIQIELKREAVPQVVLNKLYKHTPLQSTFGYNA